MAFDFPATPTTGTIYSPAGGPSYRWDGDKWQLVSTQYRLKTALARNLLINPVFNWKQGLTGPYTTGGYVGDNWALYHNLSTGVISRESRIAKVSPRGSLYRMRATVTTPQAAMAAGNYAAIETYVEGFAANALKLGLAAAIPSVLSFGWNGPAGTYTVAVSNSPITRSFIGVFIIAPGQANTDVYFDFPIPAYNAGTWLRDQGIGIAMDFALAAGSNYQGVAGWQTGNVMKVAGSSNGLAAANTFELFDVGLFADPDNTGLPPVWQPPDEIDDLQRCKRFYEIGIASGFSGNVTSGQSYVAYGQFEVAKSGGMTLSGTNSLNTSFAATVGSLTSYNDGLTFSESRTANATATGHFRSLITSNARY